MVFPLVVLTVAWDRAGLAERPAIRGRTFHWRLGRHRFVTNTFDLVAAAAFATMGAVLLVIAVTGASVATDLQAGIATWLQLRLAPVVAWLDPVPDAVVGIALVGIGLAAAAVAGRRRQVRRDPREEEE